MILGGGGKAAVGCFRIWPSEPDMLHRVRTQTQESGDQYLLKGLDHLLALSGFCAVSGFQGEAAGVCLLEVKARELDDSMLWAPLPPCPWTLKDTQTGLRGSHFHSTNVACDDMLCAPHLSILIDHPASGAQGPTAQV